MPKRLIRHLARMLGDKSLSPDSRLVAAILFLNSVHHLHCNIYAFCGALREVAHYFPMVMNLGFETGEKGVYSKKVDVAITEMQAAGFVRWNKRRDQLTILRNGPSRRHFLAEVGKFPHLEACRGSIEIVADQLCHMLMGE